MDRTPLRTHFERAVTDPPAAPQLVPRAVRAGQRLVRRRRFTAATASALALAVIAVGVPFATGGFGIGSRPAPAVAGQGGLMAYVNDGGTSRVVPIRISTDRAMRVRRVPGAVVTMASSPDGKYVYVVSGVQPSLTARTTLYVTRIEAATAREGRPIRLTGGPANAGVQSFEVAPGGRIAYASESVLNAAEEQGLVYTPTTDVIEAINLVTGAEHKLIEARGFNGQIGLPFAITPDFRTAYVAGLAGEVVPIDLATHQELAPIKVEGPDPSGIAIAPDGQTAYVASFNADAANSPAWVTPIDVAANTAGPPIELRQDHNSQNGFRITIAPNGMMAYVTGPGNVTPIDLTTFRALKPIGLPTIGTPYAAYPLVISPDSRIAWAQYVAPQVQLINLVSGTLLKPILLPENYMMGPGGGAFVPRGNILYVSAYASPGRRTPAKCAVFPINIATQQPGKPVRISGVGEVVIAG